MDSTVVCRNPARSAEVEKPFRGFRVSEAQEEQCLCAQSNSRKEQKVKKPSRFLS
jgi:hypothetical protein